MIAAKFAQGIGLTASSGKGRLPFTAPILLGHCGDNPKNFTNWTLKKTIFTISATDGTNNVNNLLPILLSGGVPQHPLS
jgi:hypothetical protein